MSFAYANAGTFARPYYMDPDCPDYLKPAQWTQGCVPANSIFRAGYAPAPMPAPVSPCAYGVDGCNDGKIPFAVKAKSFVKGIFKPVTNMFSSPGNFIKGALCIAGGAALIAVTGGAATPFLVAAGVVGGGCKIAKGAIGAATAQTDGQAIAAWEDMGEGTGVVAASVAGSKAALKKAGVNTNGMSYVQATKKCFTGARGFAKTSWANASAKMTNFYNSKIAPKTTTTPQQPQQKPITIEKGKKCATPENANSPERKLYETADEITLTEEQYAQRGAQNVQGFKDSVISNYEKQIATLDKRIATAKTPAAKKSLLGQKSTLEKAYSNYMAERGA